MKSDFDKKAVQLKVQELLKQGKSKQEIYTDLITVYKSQKKIADVVRYTPAPDKLKKYAIWNTLFLIFISIIILLLLLQSSTGAVIWLILLFVIVVTKKFKYYYWSTVLGVFTIISGLSMTLYNGMNSNFASTILPSLILLLVAGIFILAGIVLPKKLTPNYSQKNKKYINKKGESRMRTVYSFE